MGDIVQVVGAGGAFAGFGLVFYILMRYITWLQKEITFWRERALKGTELAEVSSKVTENVVVAATPVPGDLDPPGRLERVEAALDILLRREAQV